MLEIKLILKNLLAGEINQVPSHHKEECNEMPRHLCEIKSGEMFREWQGLPVKVVKWVSTSGEEEGTTHPVSAVSKSQLGYGFNGWEDSTEEVVTVPAFLLIDGWCANKDILHSAMEIKNIKWVFVNAFNLQQNSDRLMPRK